MSEYLLIFRAEPRDMSKVSPEDAASSMEEWKNWIGGIAQQGKFTGGQPLAQGGKYMTGNNKVTDTPLAEGKEVVNGYVIVKAADYNEAVALSNNCPIFKDKGSVEVREINQMEM